MRNGLMVGVLSSALAIAALAQGNPAPSRVEAEVTLGAVAQHTPSPTTEQQVTLDDLVREALEKNPGVQARLRLAEARRHRAPQARLLPDPVVSAAWMGNATPFDVQEGDPSSYRSLSVTQQFPLGGKRGLRASIAEREADATWWQYQRERWRLVAEVKAAFYEVFYARKALEITATNQDLLRKLSRIAEARYEVGKGMQQDVLRSHVEQTKLEHRITVLEQQEDTAQARLNALLGRGPESPLAPLAPVRASELPRTLEELYLLARDNDPEVQMEQRLIERGEYALRLAGKQTVPDLSVGYTYQNRPGMPEMHGGMISVNLPIFSRSKQREMVAEATLELESARRSREDRFNNLYFEIKEQYLAARSSEHLVRLFSQGVVPQSSLALESSMSAYQVGTADFLTLLTNFTTLLDYESEYYRELANLQIALARLEPLVGVELTK